MLETQMIQRALGEKASEIPFSLAIGISSLVLCLAKAWALTLCILGLSSVLCITAAAFFKIYSRHQSTHQSAFQDYRIHANRARENSRIV